MKYFFAFLAIIVCDTLCSLCDIRYIFEASVDLSCYFINAIS